MSQTAIVPAGYDLAYTAANGAQVWVHHLHVGAELRANRIVACFLANAAGETVYLLPATDEPGIKNPDAEIAGSSKRIRPVLAHQ